MKSFFGVAGLSTAIVMLFGLAAVPASAQDATKGKDVFEQCAVCHNADSAEKKMGPGLKGLYKKAKMNNGKAPSDATVSALIKTGGNGMPPYEDVLSPAELKDLLAYLKTL